MEGKKEQNKREKKWKKKRKENKNMFKLTEFPRAHEGSTFYWKFFILFILSGNFYTKRFSSLMCYLLGLDPHRDCKDVTVSLKKSRFGSWHTNKHIMHFMCANLGHLVYFYFFCYEWWIFYLKCESLHHILLYAVSKMPTGTIAKNSVYEMNEECAAVHPKVK